jgi:hypothetical protein
MIHADDLGELIVQLLLNGMDRLNDGKPNSKIVHAVDDGPSVSLAELIERFNAVAGATRAAVHLPANNVGDELWNLTIHKVDNKRAKLLDWRLRHASVLDVAALRRWLSMNLVGDGRIERIVMMPRWSGTLDDDWYRAFIAAVERERFEIVEVELAPTKDAPAPAACVAALSDACAALSDEKLSKTLFIGHSVSCQAILR